jgi:hypothetical protein
MKRKRPLDAETETALLLFYLGASYAGLTGGEDKFTRARMRETADELWQLFPYVKALLTLGREHPEALRAHWEASLREPMPGGGEPLGMPEESPGEPTGDA